MVHWIETPYWQENIDDSELQELAERVTNAVLNGLSDNSRGTSCRVEDWEKIVAWCRSNGVIKPA